MKVVHQPDNHRFVALLGDDSAVLEYHELPENRVNFNRTFVPESMRGKGVAGALVTAGVKWAENNGAAIEASCSYVQKWLERRKR